MSTLRTHLEGDCWAPCHYCLLEDDTEPDTENEDDE